MSTVILAIVVTELAAVIALAVVVLGDREGS